MHMSQLAWGIHVIQGVQVHEYHICLEVLGFLFGYFRVKVYAIELRATENSK